MAFILGKSMGPLSDEQKGYFEHALNYAADTRSNKFRCVREQFMTFVKCSYSPTKSILDFFNNNLGGKIEPRKLLLMALQPPAEFVVELIVLLERQAGATTLNMLAKGVISRGLTATLVMFEWC